MSQQLNGKVVFLFLLLPHLCWPNIGRIFLTHIILLMLGETLSCGRVVNYFRLVQHQRAHAWVEGDLTWATAIMQPFRPSVGDLWNQFSIPHWWSLYCERLPSLKHGMKLRAVVSAEKNNITMHLTLLVLHICINESGQHESGQTSVKFQ